MPHAYNLSIYIIYIIKILTLSDFLSMYRRSTPVDNPNKNADKVQSSPSKKDNNKTTAPIVKEGSPELDNAGSNGTLKKEDDKSKDGEDDMIEEGYVNVTGTSSRLMSPPVEITAPPTEANNKVMYCIIVHWLKPFWFNQTSKQLCLLCLMFGYFL